MQHSPSDCQRFAHVAAAPAHLPNLVQAQGPRLRVADDLFVRLWARAAAGEVNAVIHHFSGAKRTTCHASHLGQQGPFGCLRLRLGLQGKDEVEVVRYSHHYV